jgi:hypothetical protein
LSDLQKLGVDAVTGLDTAGHMHIDLGQGLLSADSLPKFEASADVTLDLAKGQGLDQIVDIAATLRGAGIDHVSMGWSDLLAQDEAAINTLTSAGIDFNVVAASQAGGAQNPSLDLMLQDFLSQGVQFSNGNNMGTLVQTLFDAGVAHTQSTPEVDYVTIGDDLAAALHEAGMLQALPEANVQIDAGSAVHLQTSLTAMAELGVDHVLAAAGAQVDLGAQFSADELVQLLQHFASDTDPTSTKAIFDFGAELNMGQVSTGETLQTLLESGMGQQLHDMGITKVVAQTPAVTVLGAGESYADGQMVFDLDILFKKS